MASVPKKSGSAHRASAARASRAARVKRSVAPTFASDVKAAVVASVPPAFSSPRHLRYQVVLAEVRREVGVGKPVAIAEYVGRGGATQAKRALEAGARPVDGKLSDWCFDARRTADGTASVLFATLKPTK